MNNIKYNWYEDFANAIGKESEYFDTLEEAIASAKEHVSNLRLTKKELEFAMKNNNSVVVNKVTLDEENEEVELESITSIVVNESNLKRVY